MKSSIISLGLVALAALATACSFVARDPDSYRNDTAALLEKKSGEIKQCYDGVLKGDSKVAGTVTVNFTLEKKTGKIIGAKVDPAKTTAPEALQSCVTSAISTLALDPPDRREGIASFSWEFTATQPPAPPPPAG